jgi:hypothetical protein
MSSPSAYYFNVLENQRREEARRVQAVETATALMATLNRLRAQALELSRFGEEGEGVDVPFLADVASDSRAEIEAWIIEAQRTSNVLRAGIAQAQARRADRKLLESLRRHADGKAISVTDAIAGLAPPIATGPEAAAPGPEADWRLRTAEEAARLSGRLGEEVFDDDRDAVSRLVADVAASERPGQAGVRLDQLRLAVQQALARGPLRAQHAVEAAELLGRLRGLDHPDLGPTAVALQQVADGRHPLTAELRTASRRIETEAAGAADEQYALDVVAQAFADLGYEVHPGFATELAAQGSAEFQSGRWKTYGVRVHVDNGRHIRTHLVRYESAEASADTDRRDRSVAKTFCEDLERVAVEAAEQGVMLHVNEQHPPGAAPVMVVPQHNERDSRHERTKSKPQERRL